MKSIIVIGAGGHGRSVAELILQGDEFKLIGFVDDSLKVGSTIWDYPVLGTINDLPVLQDLADCVIVAIGNNLSREKLFILLSDNNFKLASIFHSKSVISPSALIGEGCVVMAGGIVGAEAKLGKGVIVNSGAVVDHHCIVEDFGHLGVNSSMAGGAILGRCAWIQAGSAIGYGVVVSPGQIILPCNGVA